MSSIGRIVLISLNAILAECNIAGDARIDDLIKMIHSARSGALLPSQLQGFVPYKTNPTEKSEEN